MLLTIALLVAAPQTQTQMTQSAGTAYARADAEMTRAWRATLAYMKGRDAQNTTRGGGFGYAAALLESQRAWLKFRDTECVIEGGEFAGRIDAIDDDRRLPDPADHGAHRAAQVADVAGVTLRKTPQYTPSC